MPLCFSPRQMSESTTTECLRCQRKLRKGGTPDPNARAIRVSATTGFCPDCMITHFLLGIEPLRDTICGTPPRGCLHEGVMRVENGRPGLGPEIFLDQKWREQTLRPVMTALLAHTQLPWEQIDWLEVVMQWSLPFPKSNDPKHAQY